MWCPNAILNYLPFFYFLIGPSIIGITKNLQPNIKFSYWPKYQMGHVHHKKNVILSRNCEELPKM